MFISFLFDYELLTQSISLLLNLVCLIFLQELIQRAKDVRQDIGQHAEKIPEHQTFLEKDMSRAQAKLRENENRLEEIAAQQSKWEHEMLLLR